MASGRFVGTSELSNRGDALVRDITLSGDTCYITEGGKAKAVLLDINRYNALMDLMEETELPADNEIQPEYREHVSVRGILRSSTTRILRKNRS